MRLASAAPPNEGNSLEMAVRAMGLPLTTPLNDGNPLGMSVSHNGTAINGAAR